MGWRVSRSKSGDGGDAAVAATTAAEWAAAVKATAELRFRQSMELEESAREAHKSGDTLEAVELQRESVAAARFYAAVERAVRGDGRLAISLIHLAKYQAAMGEKDEAVAFSREAARLGRPAVSGPYGERGHVWNLLLLARLLDTSHDLGELTDVLRETLRVLHVKNASRAMLKSIALLTERVVRALFADRRYEQAIEVLHAQMAWLEDLEERFPGTQMDFMAAVWSLIARVHGRLGNCDEALDAAERSHAILVGRGGEASVAVRAAVATNLSSVAYRIRHLGREDAAQVWRAVAADIRKSLYAEAPEEHLFMHIYSLNSLAHSMRSSGPERAAEGLAHAQEALALLDVAVEDESSTVARWRKTVSDTAAELLCVLGRFDEALPLAREALELARILPAQNYADESIYPFQEMAERLLARIEDRVRFDKAS